MTDMPTPQTRVIGRYSILRELRRERYSVSYAAVDPVMNRQLVLKAVELLPAGPKLTGEERRRVEQAFVRQAQAAGRLQHPHIVTVFDAGLSHAFGFLVIERVNGRPLHELLAGGLRPEFVQCASIGARIADALECAHANGVAHGHLGPQHVYLQADGSPKVSGFGGWIDDGASGDEALAGTERLLPYFQNEITDETRRRDVQAIGQLLFMMLTGRAPPDLPPAGQASGEPGAITRAARKDTPTMLARLVDLALLSGTGGGPATAGALRDALTAFIWNERAENVAPNSLGIPLAPPPPRAPVHIATITPEDDAPPFLEAPAAVAAAEALPRPAVATLPVSSQTLAFAAAPAAAAEPAAPPAAATVPRSAAAAAAAPAPSGATPPAATGAPPDLGASLLEPGMLLERIRPWALKYRVALFGIGAFFALAIFLGVLLGNVHHAAGPVVAAASATPAAAAPAASQNKVPVMFHVSPWGEIIIDDKPTGVAPPLSRIELTEGRHRIEIHHDPSDPWKQEIDVHGNAPIEINHEFK
jgi:serine/threonine-protein kinase